MVWGRRKGKVQKLFGTTPSVSRTPGIIKGKNTTFGLSHQANPQLFDFFAHFRRMETFSLVHNFYFTYVELPMINIKNVKSRRLLTTVSNVLIITV